MQLQGALDVVLTLELTAQRDVVEGGIWVRGI
jgi:hypothetical protein